MRLIVTLILSTWISTLSWAQFFQNITSTADGNKIIINYSLSGVDPPKKVFVNIYSSQNNFATPLFNVTGDVGEVASGNNKQIIWEAGEETARFLKNISFQFKGEIIEQWQFTSPGNNTGIRRGKSYNIEWKGGKSTEQVTLELIKPDSTVMTITQTVNSRSYNWEVPKDIKPGKGYIVKLTCGEISIQNQITIKRKIPIVLFAVPLVGVAAIIGVISSDSAGAGNNDLPVPIEPN